MVKVTTSVIDVYSNVGVFPREFDVSCINNTNNVKDNNAIIVSNNNNNNTLKDNNNNTDAKNVTATARPHIKHYRSQSLDASGFLGDSSSDDSSETSFFGDSDDNDEVTAFFGRQGREIVNTLHRGEIHAKDARENNKINEIWRKAGRRTIQMTKVRSVDYGFLVSPRMTRKQTATTKTPFAVHHNRSVTTDNAARNFKPTHSRNFSVPDLISYSESERVNNEYNNNSNNNNNNKNHKQNNRPNTRSPSPTDEGLLQRNSYLLSPRLKRKQIDITKCSAYKEIYAHNLRLYSAVLAKQIATTGQVGREMNEIRRKKIKERALNTETSKNNQQEKVYGRSKSFGNVITGPSSKNHENEADIIKIERRSQSANSEFLRSQIQQCIPKLKDIDSKQSSQEDLIKITEESDTEVMRARSQSLLPSKELIERISARIPTSTNTNDNKADITTDSWDKRTIEAHKRKEQVQKKLASFDLMFGKTTDFLTKIKTMRNS